MFKVLDRITFYRTQKGWTEYQLAEESGLTQSTISSWYRKDMVPSISSLEKYVQLLALPYPNFFLQKKLHFPLHHFRKIY